MAQPSDAESDDETPIGLPTALEVEFTMKVFLEIGQSERHFNTIESSYRALASTWLLAVFAGVGYVISAKSNSVPLDPLVVAAALCVIGVVGVLMLWYVDIFVYHRLLDDWFEEGLKLEIRNAWLPQVRSRMLRTSGGRGVVPRVAVFYAGATTILVLTCGALLSVWVASVAMPLLPLPIVVFILLALICCIAIIRQRPLGPKRE